MRSLARVASLVWLSSRLLLFITGPADSLDPVDLPVDAEFHPLAVSGDVSGVGGG